MVEAVKETTNLICPECNSERLQKAGFSISWKARVKTKVQRYRCLDCGLVTTRPDTIALDKELVCLRCGHHWKSNDPHPTRCGKCKSPYWDKLKKEEK